MNGEQRKIGRYTGYIEIVSECGRYSLQNGEWAHCCFLLLYTPSWRWISLGCTCHSNCQATACTAMLRQIQSIRRSLRSHRLDKRTGIELLQLSRPIGWCVRNAAATSSISIQRRCWTETFSCCPAAVFAVLHSRQSSFWEPERCP